MRITILGSGTCVPSLERSSCSVLVETCGKKILIDCGPGTMRRVLEAGHSVLEIDLILISHFHPDHCGELVNFLFSTKYPYDDQRKGLPLKIAGGPGLLAFYSSLSAVYGDWMNSPTAAFGLEELNPGASIAICNDFIIEAGGVSHRPESIAFRIKAEDKSFVYSGDTDYSETLAVFARECDLFVCESAMPDGMKVPGHLTPSLAGKIAAFSGVRHLVLTHFYPECSDYDIENQCRISYSGKLTLARDLMVFDL